MVYTQAYLEQLITCAKEVLGAPRKDMVLVHGSWRNDMELQALEGRHRFHVFMRRNDDFTDEFSIGLEFLPADGTPRFALMRCNGPHGHVAGVADHPHYDFHIHKADAFLLESGESPLRKQEHTEAYGSYEQALRYFLTTVNIQLWERYFPRLARQLGLFETREEM
jgi:hypothetical protein